MFAFKEIALFVMDGFGRQMSDLWSSLMKSVWSKAKRYAGIPMGVKLACVVDMKKLEKVKYSLTSQRSELRSKGFNSK